MNQMKSRAITLAAVLLLLVIPSLIYAASPSQLEPASPPSISAPISEGEIPPLEEGAPYPYPIISYEPGPDVAPASPNAPVIQVWYGNTQNFGQLGNPQEMINILGNVSGTPPVTSLKFSLNGGADQTLNFVANQQRLYSPGDFNIEIPIDQLNEGANTVVIKAHDGVTQTTQNVIVNYDAGNTWPLPYTANWSAMSSIQAGAQVVDGKWGLIGGQLETVIPGYDRLVAIGDMSWTDYEVTVPVTVKSLNTAEWGPPSNGAGVGLLLRWLGHTNASGDQPGQGWRRLGVLAWHRWAPNGNTAFELVGNGGKDLTRRTDQTIALNTTYIFKVSVQTAGFSGEPSTYRFKYWPQGQPEPPGWFMSAAGNAGEPDHGSLMLVAHQAVVSFGNVQVRPLPAGPFTVNVQDPENGTIFVTPNKAGYTYGERVTIRSQGEAGFGMANWTGDFNGNQNPIVLDVTQNITVGANFQPLADEIKLIVTPTGQGTVNINPKKNKYNYGELVNLTPQPAVGFIFAGWSGDLLGANNPAFVVMDRSRTITANFVPANTTSPVSDDFNACGLNTGLWTFIHPGDGTYNTNGTQLLLNVPANVSHNIWLEGNRSVRVMQPTQNVDFEIVTRFESSVTQRYQMQGILVEQDSLNYLRFEVYHDGSSTKLFAARFQDGNPRPLISNVELGATPPYLRVTRVGGQWGFSFSNNGNDWIAGGSFNYNLNVVKTGVYGANHGTPPGRPAPAYTAIVDYFFNSAAPIVPEDGDTPGNFTLTTTKVGQGTVTASPSKTTYACGEKVTLTATPVAGWAFAGWSGDLTGTAASQQLTVSRNHTVTATFVRADYRLFLPSVRK